MNDNFIPEKVLVEQIVSGDQSAFRTIFCRYKDKLFSYCYRFTKTEATAEEIVHDVFLKIWTERERINPELSFSSYLYKITRNQALNFMRKAAADQSLRDKLRHYFEQYDSQCEDQIIYNDLFAIVQRAVALLPPRRRLIYEMSREQAMKDEEIAHRLRISKQTVKNQMVKALSFIRRYLKSHGEMTICFIYVLFFS